MNRAIGLQLLGCGFALIGLSSLVFLLARPLATPTLITGLAGGLLCLVAGFRAAQGDPRKGLPLLVLIPMTIVLVSQAVMTWGPGTPEIPARWLAWGIVCLLLALSFGMLMRVAYAGSIAVGQSRAPGKESARKQQGIGTTSAKAEAGKP